MAEVSAKEKEALHSPESKRIGFRIRTLISREYPDFAKVGHQERTVSCHAEVDHMIILIEETQKLYVGRRVCNIGRVVWMTNEIQENILPRGRHLVCLCNIRGNTNGRAWTDKVCIRLSREDRQTRRMISPRALPDEQDETKRGCLMMIKKTKEALSLQYLCHEYMEEKDVLFIKKQQQRTTQRRNVP